MKDAVITDVQANLPALEALRRAIKDDGCDAIFRTAPATTADAGGMDAAS